MFAAVGDRSRPEIRHGPSPSTCSDRPSDPTPRAPKRGLQVRILTWVPGARPSGGGGGDVSRTGAVTARCSRGERQRLRQVRLALLAGMPPRVDLDHDLPVEALRRQSPQHLRARLRPASPGPGARPCRSPSRRRGAGGRAGRPSGRPSRGARRPGRGSRAWREVEGETTGSRRWSGPSSGAYARGRNAPCSARGTCSRRRTSRPSPGSCACMPLTKSRAYWRCQRKRRVHHHRRGAQPLGRLPGSAAACPHGSVPQTRWGDQQAGARCTAVIGMAVVVGEACAVPRRPG